MGLEVTRLGEGYSTLRVLAVSLSLSKIIDNLLDEPHVYLWCDVSSLGMEVNVRRPAWAEMILISRSFMFRTTHNRFGAPKSSSSYLLSLISL